MGVNDPTPPPVAAAVCRIRTPQIAGSGRDRQRRQLLQESGRSHRRAKALRRRSGFASYPTGATEKASCSAAWLIEACGWRGHRDGDAGVRPPRPGARQSRQASGAQILALARRVAESARERFGVELEPEPRIVGARCATGLGLERLIGARWSPGYIPAPESETLKGIAVALVAIASVADLLAATSGRNFTTIAEGIAGGQVRRAVVRLREPRRIGAGHADTHGEGYAAFIRKRGGQRTAGRAHSDVAEVQAGRAHRRGRSHAKRLRLFDAIGGPRDCCRCSGKHFVCAHHKIGRFQALRHRDCRGDGIGDSPLCCSPGARRSDPVPRCIRASPCRHAQAADLRVVGRSEIEVSPMRCTVNVALLLTAPSVATTSPVCGDGTGDVLNVKFCVAFPSGTVTAAGSCVDARVSLNDTEVPPGPASPESVTVPVTVLHPAAQLPLLSVRELSWMPSSDVNT